MKFSPLCVPTLKGLSAALSATVQFLSVTLATVHILAVATRHGAADFSISFFFEKFQDVTFSSSCTIFLSYLLVDQNLIKWYAKEAAACENHVKFWYNFGDNRKFGKSEGGKGTVPDVTHF